MGQVSSIMRVLTSKDSDLLSDLDENNEPEVVINNSSLKRLLDSNHELDAGKGKNKGYLPLQHKLGFRQTFEKITKSIGFHLTFQTANLQDTIYTTPAYDITVTNNKLYLFVPIYIPNP